ncbi:MAG TPA: phosphatase PAP2 family protein [Candidatus Limnocylindrales bacterium]|nr:phosphatase PAP2 family protein [Candidatus Limnocylindrales bacterium]
MSVLTDERLRLRLALVALACLAGFLAIAVLVRAGATIGLDTAGLDAFRPFHGTVLDPVFVAISELGVADILQFFTMIPAGFLWVAGARRAALYLVTGYLAATIVTELLKAALPLARPGVAYQIPLQMSETEDLLWIAFAAILVIAFWRTRWRWGAVLGVALYALGLFFDPMPLATPGLDSFPSGHSLRSMVLVTSLLFALPTGLSRRALGALVVVVVLIGVSRVYLGEHHPTDVIAGWLAGLALITALALIPFFRHREEILRIDGGVVEGSDKRRLAQ